MEIESYLKDLESLVANTLPTQIKARACRDVPMLLALVRKYREALERAANPVGAYRHDRYEHARNIIEETQKVAQEALQFDPRNDKSR